jgi:hypothetical protein
MKRISITFAAVLLIFSASLQVVSRSTGIVKKETVYVPAYSSIFHGDLKWEFNLSITLSIHNVDLKNKIIISSIDYYNSSGKLIHQYIASRHLELKPLETYNLGIKETDARGGVGASFIVKWHSYSKANSPIIEAIMISTRGQQGLSFTSRGIIISE